jgi:hypothetical protein
VKTRTWIGWAVTGLMAALMLLSAAPDVLRSPEAVTVFRRLGYPPYLLLFLGTAKMLGVGRPQPRYSESQGMGVRWPDVRPVRRTVFACVDRGSAECLDAGRDGIDVDGWLVHRVPDATDPTRRSSGPSDHC